jgi:PAS domain S-box-containing protein
MLDSQLRVSGTQKKRTFIWFITLVIPILLALNFKDSQAFPELNKSHFHVNDGPPHVLVIHSYYPTFTWTDNITEGIRSAFSKSDYADSVLYFEYMDAKRHPESHYLDLYAGLLAAKYPNPNEIDVIICSDDQALNFLLERSDTLLPGIPVVFCGVNGYRPEMRQYGRPLTGVIETIDPKGTLEMALTLQPDIRRVLVISDITRTGRAIEQHARKVFSPFEKLLTFQYISDVSMSELQHEVAALQKQAIVFLFVFNRDNQGHDFTHEESLVMIDRHCCVPIYAPWTFYLGHGIVGGLLTSGIMQGRTAAQIALRVLDGESAEDIPVVMKSPNRYFFDYHKLSLHKLPLDRLPSESQIINRPFSFYHEYRYHIWVAVMALFIQMAVILLLLFNTRRREHAEKQLIASEQRYRTLIETVRDLVFIIEPNGNIAYLNPEFEKITGYPPEDFIGRPFFDVLAPEYVESTIDRFKRGIAGEEIPVYEVKVKHKNRGNVPIEMKVTSMLNKDGETVGRIGVGRDIRERTEAEEAKRLLENRLQRAQKMEAIGTLAGGVAHDLNNILSGIVSYPDLLLTQLSNDSPLRRPIQTIKDSGQKAAAIVQDLLTLARRGVANTEVVNLNSIVSDYLASPVCEKLKSLHPDVDIEVYLDKDLLNIMASPIQLSKSLMNLVFNAAEAMPNGGKIRIITENRYVDCPIRGYDRVEEGDYAVLIVSDTGVGISPEDRERIFEPFFTNKVMGKSGTGLGMAVVWGTLKDLNGYIDIKSTKGHGSTFTLYFPVTRETPVLGKDSISEDVALGKGEKILVVDDIETQRKIACLILSQLGYSAVAISSGEEAVRYLKDHKADLILLDMIMDPGMDGLDTYRNILKMHPRQKAIIVSGFSETIRVKEAQQLGAGQYLKKPYTIEKLGEAIRNELDNTYSDAG